MNASKIWSLGLMAMLLTSTIAAVLPIERSYAAVSITSSSDKFFGPSLVRVVITDTALSGSPSDTINVDVEVRRGTTTVGSATGSVKEIGTSGQFELYIAAHTNANATNPTQQDPDDVTVFRIYNGVVNSNAGDDNIPTTVGISTNLESGDRIVIRYGGEEKTINFDSTTASLTTDRTTAGNGNKIILRLNDPDANIDPTRVDEFAANATNLISPTLTFASGAKWVETGQNTGIFELVVGVNSMVDANLAVTNFPSTATFTVQDHEVYAAYPNAKPPYNARDSTTSTSSATVQIRNTDGRLELAADLTLANGFQLRIVDADRNVDTTSRDSFDAAIFGSGTVPFKETGDNTGIFVVDLANNRVPIVIATTTEFDNTNKVYKVRVADIDDDITLTYDDPQQDPSGSAEFSIVRDIRHFAGTIETTTPSLSVNGIGAIIIRDGDLNTDSTVVNSYTISFTGGVGQNEFSGLGDVEVSVAGKSFTGSLASILFTEVDANGNPAPNTGIFRGELRMSDVNNKIQGGLSDGDKVKIEYKDNTESPAVTRSVEITIGRPAGVISIDRTTYPPSIANLGSTKIYVTIEDPTFNESSNSEDALNLNDFNGNNPQPESLRIEFIRGSEKATFKPNTNGKFDPIDGGSVPNNDGSFPSTASETDVNTGVFEVDIVLPTSVTKDGTEFIADGTQIRLIYRDSDGNDRDVSATITTNTASLSTDKTAINLGDDILLTVNERDWNFDSDEIDEIDPAQIILDGKNEQNLAQWDGNGLSLDTDTIRETGPNTGIFTILIKDIDNRVSDRGSTITFKYEDETPSGGGSEIEIEHSVVVLSLVPEIVFDKEVYTPFEEACITIIDPAANLDSDVKDKISVTITGRETVKFDDSQQNKFVETEVNSGVFEADTTSGCVQLYALSASNAKIPADGIVRVDRDSALRVEYKPVGMDERLTKSVLIGFNDGSISFDKSTYRVGETAIVTVIDPDLNKNPTVEDQITDIRVFSSTDRAGIQITLRETGKKTGVFTGTVLLSSDVSSGNRLQVNDGDTITARYTDETLPDPASYNPSRDATVTTDVRRIDTTATIGISKLPIERVPASEPEILDEAGNELEVVTIGSQVLISSKITNNQTIRQDFVHIFKVSDDEGNVLLLTFTSGTLNPGEVRTNGVSWTPEEAGIYTVEIFVWKSFDEPIALSPKITFTVEVE